MKINIGGTGLLTLAFFIAKVTGYISWSWWIVFAPTWVPLVLLVGFMGVCFLIAMLTGVK